MTEFYLKIPQQLYAKLPIYVDEYEHSARLNTSEKDVSFRNEHSIQSAIRIYSEHSLPPHNNWLVLYFNDVEHMMNFQLQYL
jgi:hypothetical protein